MLLLCLQQSKPFRRRELSFDLETSCNTLEYFPVSKKHPKILVKAIVTVAVELTHRVKGEGEVRKGPPPCTYRVTPRANRGDQFQPMPEESSSNKNEMQSPICQLHQVLYCFHYGRDKP